MQETLQRIVDIVLGEALLPENRNQSLRQTVDILGVSLRRIKRLRKDNFYPRFLKHSATMGKATGKPFTQSSLATLRLLSGQTNKKENSSAGVWMMQPVSIIP